ncbi:hypothetical protein [Vibrio europaeus]|uniref:Uncharacterized protein n=1 Tax=Vibrio europaeus TaxID=300876 RepID=A0A178JG15_9VIBR|nr:hypothetical protein [Vibrio europaeus]MDC5704575.1 hypothetical protein [Vibrio europaeus]MDC5712073.1 hypothetical protein [Vibrio europaeus]MDC5717801.1 hypothetical protein [Vibrio europaeus]MDC5727698.1 hypothetical protein [Vibrio europaeus]MDC5731907.1 hypothetical protein [Vibrio europaeus]
MNTALKVLLGLVGLFALLFYVVYPIAEWSESTQAPFGASLEDKYIVIRGKKPIDAHVSAYGTFYGGEECKSFSWSASDGEIRAGGKSNILFDHNFAKSNDTYELRLPYKGAMSSGCDMKLHQITVDAKNTFDTVGFAELRIYSPVSSTDSPLSFNSLIEAKDCNGDVFKSIRKVWAGAIGCHFYIDNKQRTKDEEFNAFTVYYDFSKFNDDTVIHYDISAGEGYRTEPVDENHGTE